MVTIINNLLKWDGTHLGNFPKSIFTQQWMLEATTYYSLTLPERWSPAGLPGGVIYCNASRTKDAFPCIVEDIKSIFDIPRRGIHRINIGELEYVLYYVPISTRGEIIWETPLSRLDNKHPLREDPHFRRAVQRIIAFCDILALSSTGEPTIRIRPGVRNQFVPINSNEVTTITKVMVYDFSVLSKTIFSKWFGEETVIGDVVREMVQYTDRYVFLPETYDVEPTAAMTILCASIRSKIDRIINRYDSSYIWYSCFIIDRMSRHLL